MSSVYLEQWGLVNVLHGIMSNESKRQHLWTVIYKPKSAVDGMQLMFLETTGP